MLDGLVITGGARCVPEQRRNWDDWPLSDQPGSADGEYVRVHRLLLAEQGHAPAAASAALRPHWRALLDPADASYACCATRTQSELALAATGALLARTPGLAQQCGLAIYSAISIDEDLVLSVPCRLIAEAGLRRAHAFALGQNQGADFFQALTLARACFGADPALSDALLVSAEKWLPPFARLAGASACHADGAAALHLQRGAGQRGLHLLGHSVAPGGGTALDPVALRARQGEQLAATIHALLEQHRLRPSDLAVVLPQGVRAELRNGVASHLGLRAAQVRAPAAQGYLGAADTPCQLAALLECLTAGDACDGGVALAWGIGFGGSNGAALFRLRA